MIVIFGSIIVFIIGIANIFIGHKHDDDFWIFIGIMFMAVSLMFAILGGYMIGIETYK